jgi:hypothetical protein
VRRAALGLGLLLLGGLVGQVDDLVLGQVDDDLFVIFGARDLIGGVAQINAVDLSETTFALFVVFLVTLRRRGVIQRVLGRHGSTTQGLVVTGNWDEDHLEADARTHAWKRCNSLHAVARVIVGSFVVEHQMKRDRFGQVLDSMLICLHGLYQCDAVGASRVVD